MKSWLMTTANFKIMEHFRRVKKENCVPLTEVSSKNGHGGPSSFSSPFGDSGGCGEALDLQALRFIIQCLQLDTVVITSSTAPMIRAEADRRLSVALSGLKPVDRKIIGLVYYKRKKSAEIGVLLKLKPNTVRKKHERALKKLYQLLTEGRG